MYHKPFLAHLKTRLLPVSLLLFACLAVSAQTAKTNTDLPKGDWTLSFHAHQGPDYLQLPAMIYSVSSSKGQVTKFAFTNISSRTIKAIKVRWLVYQDEDRARLLADGSTPMLTLKTELPSGINGYYTYNVVHLNDFAGRFAAAGRVNKNFNVDLLIDEVIFADNVHWKRGDGSAPGIEFDLASKIEAALLDQDCPKQKCVSTQSTTTNNGTSYKCEGSSLSESCTNAPDGGSCSMQICGPRKPPINTGY